MFYKAASLAVLAAVLAGHASVSMAESTQDAERVSFTAKPGLAVLYVFRANTPMAPTQIDVEIDGQAFGKNEAKTYLYADLAPGRHVVLSKGDSSQVVELDATAGQVYFFRQEPAKLLAVSETEGKAEVSHGNAAAAAQNFFPSQAAMKKREAALAAYTASGKPNSFEPIDPMAGKPVAAQASASNTYDPIDPSTKMRVADSAPSSGRIGVSSFTVEKLARGRNCEGVPAYLIKVEGPREEYEAVCKDKRVVRAACVFHQCRMLE